jgi:hypothetical protein
MRLSTLWDIKNRLSEDVMKSTGNKQAQVLGGLLLAALGLAVVLGWLAFGPGGRPVPSGAERVSGNPVVSGAMAVAAFGETLTFNAGAGNSIKLTLLGNVASSSIANPTLGQLLTLLLCQDEAGSHTLAWPENVRLAGGTFALSGTPGKCDALTLVYDGNDWYETGRSLDQ